MDITIDQAVSVLEEQLAQVDKKVELQQKQLASEIEVQKRLRAAVGALKGGKVAAPNGKPKKECVKKADVISIVKDHLHKSDSVSVDDLRKFTEKAVVNRNLSLSGFAMRFKEALKTPDFEISPENVVSLQSRENDRSVA